MRLSSASLASRVSCCCRRASRATLAFCESAVQRAFLEAICCSRASCCSRARAACEAVGVVVGGWVELW
eukprot:2793505-Prymnesium_polylepis.1